MNLLAQSRPKIADIVAEHLIRHFASEGETPSFFALPGQDPTAFELPAQSLSSLYWQGTSEQQRRRFVGVLLDLAGRRADGLPLQAVQTLLLTVGSISKPEALLPLVRVLGARTDLGDHTFNLFGIALQVAKGLGPVNVAWDAVYEMAGFRSFPEKLVFDAFDICVVDTRSLWERWFERLEPAMMRVTNVSRRTAMEKRLARTASGMASRMSISSIERGLKALLGRRALEPQNAELLNGQWPRQMLAAKLVLTSSAPMRICRGASGAYFLIHRTDPELPDPQQGPRHTAQIPRVLQSLQLEPDHDELVAEA